MQAKSHALFPGWDREFWLLVLFFSEVSMASVPPAFGVKARHAILAAYSRGNRGCRHA